MISPRWRKALTALMLSLVLIVSACSSQEPSRYSQIQEETSGRNAPAAVADEAVQGSNFNQFFPRSVAGYDIVPYQEKNGFAEYKVNQDGKNVAMLAINDTTGTPAAAKFQNSEMSIAGYPAVEQGQNATAILVNDRFQVKVLSRDPAFTKDDRAAWIEKFDLAGLADLS
ncbi:hypothetical protein C7B76_01700 [filamentous cyanobacterium CCP2]|nr:hypothetical protein C7B76_01700 [filamentous cyanobacterium CCP2]